MIEQKDIYKAAQSAFKKWPKKELEKQDDTFKREFLMFCADINAQHERVVSEYRTNLSRCEPLLSAANDLLTAYKARTHDIKRELRIERKSKRVAVFCFIFLLVIMFFYTI
jgi:hypothetical protein